MKKNVKTLSAYKRELELKNALLPTMKGKFTANSLSEEAKAEAEALINEKQAEIESIKSAIEELEAAEENKDEELKSKIAELQRKQEELENSLKSKKFLEVTNSVKLQEFMKSPSTAKALMNTIMKSESAKDFRSNWGKVLTENGITPADTFLPQAIVEKITDVFERGADNFMRFLDVTNLKVYKSAIDTNESDSARAHGHKAGEEKKEEEVQLITKELRPQYIYKYLTVDREMIDENDENGVLGQYIANELAYRIMHEIMRAILVGDGRTDGANVGKITKFEAITNAADTYKTNVTSTKAELFINLATAAAGLRAEGDKVLCINPATLIALRTFVFAEGGTKQLKAIDALAAELGVEHIVATNVVPADKVLVFVGRAYKVVGNFNPETFENFVLAYNKKEFLAEVYAGGALTEYKSAAVVTITD